MRKSFFVFILFSFHFNLLGAQLPQEEWQSKYEAIKDLNREWITIDDNDRYVPYINKKMTNVPLIGVVLNTKRYSSNDFLICAPANSAVLIEKKISSYFQEEGCLVLDIDSLRASHGKENILISVYQPQKDFESIGLWVVQDKKDMTSLATNLSQIREMSILQDYFTAGILILLVLYAILINQYPRIFRNLYDLSRVFSLKIREDNSRIRLVNEAHVMFLVQHCFLIAFLFIMLVSTTNLIEVSIPYINFEPNSFGGYMLLWAQVALLVLATIWLKYIIVMLFGALFKLRQLRSIYMLDYMRMSLIYSAFLFALLIVVFAGIGYYNDSYFNVIIYLFILLASVRVIVLYFRLFRNASFRNVYLFSYICIAEVIPLLVGLEVLVI
ncbi:DUF4271 domain-containing protein [Porifericola rhodea]|uniref:DUF4271 domain-containing protein n=1 Tax=Porifericola rhodea TaxID=930972 RepID=UPI002665D551|nr:DUF4271 domain-containing protein [Porifericola rhodea]WKN33642.1 DUF4271 domain-containing protein [Porifericola rhodea]